MNTRHTVRQAARMKTPHYLRNSKGRHRIVKYRKVAKNWEVWCDDGTGYVVDADHIVYVDKGSEP